MEEIAEIYSFRSGWMKFAVKPENNIISISGHGGMYFGPKLRKILMINRLRLERDSPDIHKFPVCCSMFWKNYEKYRNEIFDQGSVSVASPSHYFPELWRGCQHLIVNSHESPLDHFRTFFQVIKRVVNWTFWIFVASLCAILEL